MTDLSERAAQPADEPVAWDAVYAMALETISRGLSPADAAAIIAGKFAATHPAPAAEPATPPIWVVFDETGQAIHCANWPEACHEHINDAINDFDIKEAAKWTVQQR